MANVVNSRGEVRALPMNSALRAALLAVAALISLFLLNPFRGHRCGERGVVLNFGAVPKDVLDEGLHLRVPVMQRVVLMDVRVQKAQTDADAASKDLQDTHSTIAINYHLRPSRAN